MAIGKGPSPGPQLQFPVTLSACFADLEVERQAHRAVQADRGAPLRVRADAWTLEARRQRRERLLQLGASQRGAQAVVRSVAEREVGSALALRGVDRLGVREGPLVLVRAPERHEDPLPGGEGTPRRLGRLARRAAEARDAR